MLSVNTEYEIFKDPKNKYKYLSPISYFNYQKNCKNKQQNKCIFNDRTF